LKRDVPMYNADLKSMESGEPCLLKRAHVTEMHEAAR
jgi:hypothetical protein